MSLSVQVQSLPFSEIPEEVISSGLVLSELTWPSGKPLEERLADLLEKRRLNTDARDEVMWHWICDGPVVVAKSASFRRIVATESGWEFPILALAGVCTHPDYRGKGLGRSVVQAAWDRIGEPLPICFYQTGVPKFYERMGARLVRNRIYDGTGKTAGLWDKYAMIYPAAEAWPEEAIDLRGPGW